MLVKVSTAPAKESGAPIITVEQAKVKLIDPEFSVKPVEVEGRDGSTWSRDPGLNALIEIVDDMDDGMFDFDMTEWDGFEFMTKIVPKKNPTTKQLCGSMCHHETIMAIPDPSRKKKGAKSKIQQAQEEVQQADLSPEEEKLLQEAMPD